jgi:outer membrane lipoprotein SlyB
MMTLNAGCATVRPSEYRPMIDTKGVDPAQHERDVAECQTFARQISEEQSAANGAVAGAILGLIVGAAFGLRNSNLGSVVAGGAAN